MGSFFRYSSSAALIIVSIFANNLYAEYGNTVSYLRMQSRAATVNSVDAAYYNPAGLVHLKDGLYMDFEYQLMTKTISHRIFYSNGEEDTPSLFMPAFVLAYKKGWGSIFASLSMPEGVESVHYTEPQGGVPLLASLGLDLDPVRVGLLRQTGFTLLLGPLEVPALNYIKAERYWLQARLGGAFSLTKNIAFTGGVAFSYFDEVQSAGLMKLGTGYKTEMRAYGWSGFVGIMFSSPKKAVLAILYSTEVIARGTDFDRTMHYTRIAEQRLSDYLLIGLNLLTSDKASIQISYQINFSGEKDYGTKNILTSNHELGYLDWVYLANESSALSSMPLIAHGNAQNYKYRNRHRIGLGIEVGVGGIYPSLGFSYSTQERYPRAQNPLYPDLKRIGIGAGLKAQTSDAVSLETGAASYFYITDRMLFKSIKMNKTSWTWGVSMTIKIL
jgi:hypothetical protein